MTFKQALLGITMLSSVMPVGGVAFAQTQTAAADTTSGEIVVTARRREERLQEVPLAITAFTAEQMQGRQVRELRDIAALTPGLNFEGYLGGSGTPVIRGASQQRITDLDQNVSTFFDGIFLPRQYAVNPGVIGLERVEVVKGPQSALYGRNAFSGAINYVARKPGDEWRGSVEGTIGIYSRFDGIVEAGGPIIKDKLFVQFGFGISSFDGDQINSHPNAGVDISPGSSGRLGGWNNKSYQGRVIFTPTETLTFDFGVYHFDTLAETPAVIQRKRSDGPAIGATNCGATKGGNRTLFCGELPFRFQGLPGGAQPSEANVDPRNVGLDSDSTILVGKAGWAPTEGLSINYEYGRVETDAVSGGSSDTDPVLGSINFLNPAAPRANQFQVSPVGDVTYSSHELRVEFKPTAGLDLLIGGITSKLDDFDRFPLAAGLTLLGTQPYDINSPEFITLTRARTLVDTQAIFGRINWQVTDQLRFAAEARYQWEDKAVTSGPTTFNPAVGTFNGSWTQFTPRFTVDYRATDNNMFYATIANGKKAGGINGGAILPAERFFDPDSNWTYEIGTKNTFLDGAMTVNAALFYIDWSNRQVSITASGAATGIVGPGIIGNAGPSSVKGFEIDASWTVAEGLNLRAAFSYNDAKYDEGVIDTRQRDFRNCDDIACAANGDIGGNQLERQSKVQGVFSADYTTPISNSLKAFGGFDASYKSKQFSDSVNLAFLPDRFLVDARIGIRSDAWSVTLWARNLFNEQYVTSSFATFAATDTVYVPIKGANRTAGLTGRFNF
jgi:iron complex outermembrane recepter protein